MRNKEKYKNVLEKQLNYERNCELKRVGEISLLMRAFLKND